MSHSTTRTRLAALLRSNHLRVAAAVGVIGVAAIAADALAAIAVDGEGQNRHKCWYCATNPPNGGDCTLENADDIRVCRSGECANCDIVGGELTATCNSCVNGLPIGD